MLASHIEDTVEIQFTSFILPSLRSPSSYSLLLPPHENVQEEEAGSFFNTVSYFLVDPLSAFVIVMVEFIRIV